MRGMKRAKATGKAYMKWVKGSSEARKEMRADAKKAGKPLNKAYADWKKTDRAARKETRGVHVAGVKKTSKAYMKWSRDASASRKKRRKVSKKAWEPVGKETTKFLRKNMALGKTKRAKTRALAKNFVATARGKKVEEAMELAKRSKRNIKAFKQSHKEYLAAKYPKNAGKLDAFKAGGRFHKEIAKGVGKSAVAGTKGLLRTGKAVSKELTGAGKKAGKEYRTWGRGKRNVPRALALTKRERKGYKAKKKAMRKAAFTQADEAREEIMVAIIETLLAD